MGTTDDNPICVDVVEALARVEGTPPGDLEFTLYDHVHVDALELLSGDDRGPWQLSFEVPGHDVTVRDDGTIVVDGRTVDDGG